MLQTNRNARKKCRGGWFLKNLLPSTHPCPWNTMPPAQGSLTSPSPTGCCKIAASPGVSHGSRSRGLGFAGGDCLEQVPPAQSELGRGSRVETSLDTWPGVRLSDKRARKDFFIIYLFIFPFWLLWCRLRLTSILLGMAAEEGGTSLSRSIFQPHI